MQTTCRLPLRQVQVRSGSQAFVTRAVLLGACLWLLLPGLVSAHALLIESNLIPGRTISSAPDVAQWIFNEPLNPELTKAEVTDATGNVLTSSPGSIAPGTDATWELPLPHLPDGTYTVIWRSESATDGHVAKSSYIFQVAPAGATPHLGPVPMSFNGDPGSGSGITLPSGTVPYIILHWMTLAAGVAWLGALLIEVLVLGRSRRLGAAPEQRLARLATPRVWRFVQIAPAVALVTLIGEQVAVGYEATGSLGSALSPSTIAGELSSQYGTFAAIRLVLLLVALVVALLVRVPAAEREPSPQRFTGLAFAPQLITGIALVYMLLVAWSGHAVDLSPLWLALAVDWVHLVGTAAWIGVIAALAWGVMPLLYTLLPHERAYAVLPLLNRYSPLAYAAVVGLVLSGIYNAVNHLSTPGGTFTGELRSTIYGQLALLKSVLLVVLVVLSASHTFLLRPWIARMERAAESGNDEGGMFEADAEEGLGALPERLRFEAYIGAIILLAASAMSQTLP
jgi:copper transport protein